MRCSLCHLIAADLYASFHDLTDNAVVIRLRERRESCVIRYDSYGLVCSTVIHGLSARKSFFGVKIIQGRIDSRFI